jgi:hypothetical protein
VLRKWIFGFGFKLALREERNVQNRVSFVKYNTGCKAWQNVMIAGINTGVSHGAFSADPGLQTQPETDLGFASCL